MPALLDCSHGALHESLIALEAQTSEQDAWWHDRDDLALRLRGAALADLQRTVRKQLDEAGAVVLRLGANVAPDSIRLLQLVLGEASGRIVTIAPDEPGRPLFKVSAVEGQGQTGGYKGNAKKRESIGFHTDGSGVSPPVTILSMACIRQAPRGGESRLADAPAVHQLMSREALRVLESPLPRENPYRALPPEELVLAPVFELRRNIEFSYHPARVRNGIASVRGKLTPEESGALAELDTRLDEAAIDFRLEAGDIVMLDNRRIAHDRRPFTDDPDAPRLIERLWIGRDSTIVPSPRLCGANEVGELDVLLYATGHEVPEVPCAFPHALPPSPVGPTFRDLDDVIGLLRQQRAELGRPLRVGAHGGARVLATAALSVGLIERRLAEGQLASSLHGDFDNWIGEWPRRFRLVDELEFYPVTILAVQASPAITWICNDPAEESTYFASSRSLVASRYSLDFLKIPHGTAIVAGVLLECVHGTPHNPGADATRAQHRAGALLQDLGLAFETSADLHTVARLAFASRDECENIIGPDMPGLALKQAVERVLGRDGASVDADCVAAWLIPDVNDRLRRDRAGFDRCFAFLRSAGDGDRPDIPQRYFPTIAGAAASTKLAKGCLGATVGFYEAVLQENFQLRTEASSPGQAQANVLA